MSTSPPPDESPDSNPPEMSGSTRHADVAIADLRERLGDPDADVEVVSVEEVDWPDGSLGCPQPGMVYTQAIVNGSKILLRHAGTLYPYHQGGSREAFYCPPGTSKTAPSPPPADLDV